VRNLGVRNPGRKSGSEIRVRNLGSEIRVGNPEIWVGNPEIRVGNPGQKSGSGSEMPVESEIRVRTRTDRSKIMRAHDSLYKSDKSR
jgi:hypothetical protein